jgi:hypothetical protein
MVPQEQLQHGDAEPPDVVGGGAARAGLGVGREPLVALVRGHADGDGDAAGYAGDVVEDLGLAKVADLDVPIGVHEHVVGVHVEVRDVIRLICRPKWDHMTNKYEVISNKY